MSSSEDAVDPAQHPWGRVGDDGTVYVRTADGERIIGQWPGANPQEAIRLYANRFAGLATEVDLVEKRIAAGTLSPDDAERSITKVRDQVTNASALGDLDALLARLDALTPALDALRERHKAERETRMAEALAAKTRLVEQAEQLAAGSNWRGGQDALRDHLAAWKELARLDRHTDNELWQRFSTARTTYSKRRKAHFADVHAQRRETQLVKEKLIAEAEALSASTEWGPTTTKYRDLMTRWKQAGSAPRDVEDDLWKRFRAAQDVFFSARDAANAVQDEEFRANAVTKEQILLDAEKLVPVTDLDAARRAWVTIADRWEAAGKVPRDRIKELEGRLRVVEKAINSAREAEWKRSDPEKSARADDMVGKLEAAIAELESDLAAARESGDAKKIASIEENLASRQAFLDMARQAASEFGG